MNTLAKLRWASGLAVIFLIAHVLFLPSTLEDVDSLNFALGLHDFDPTKHQPHPPGYPVFMALGKIARTAVPSDAKALAVLGAIFGALAVFPLMRLFENLDALADDGRSTLDDRRWTIAPLATILVIASPLYWFNALRPLSDIPGLAFTLAAQAALSTAYARQRMNPETTPDALAASGQMIVLGAFLSAMAIGMRSQALWLTVPLLLLVLLQRAGRGAAGALLGSAMTFSIGTLIWFVPLVFASGGLRAYRAALGAQGGEDFAGVDMLYGNPSARRLAFSLLETFIYPWASIPLGWLIFALAVFGMVMLLWRSPRVAVLVAVLVGPYTVFHLLFHETVTTRYALPILPVVAFLAVYGVRSLTRTVAQSATTVAVAVVVVWSLVLTLPAARIYAREGSPAFAAIRDLHEALRAEPRAVIGMHQGLARSVQTQNFGNAQVLKSPPMREWLELAGYWLAGNTAPVWFLADPARTDTELIDPLSRTVRAHYVWEFPRERFMSGVRPDIVDLIRIDSPPAWFAVEGWHLTPETLNMSERLGKREGTAYIRSRQGAALMLVGGESTGAGCDVTLSINDRVFDRWNVPAGGTFFKRFQVPPGALASAAAFNSLVASYATPDGKPGSIRLTQFTVEPPDAVFFVQHAGWNEIEYSKGLQRRWRWTTGRASTFVNSGGRDVWLSITGESPLTYFDSAPTVVVRAGSQVLATASPAADFRFEIKIPAGALQQADGMVTIETDKTFVPNERSGSPDKRTLGLRIFTFDVR
ncbi:MAG: DUF2723 domain-containing protein [Vicinamibacterales bacterium]|nr:DUF2723 domain-containing protein [Vicinamibacterales bacterium]